MSAPRWFPERADLIWIDFDPQSGHEQAGRRPALVLSPGTYNGPTGLALVCPITSRQKGYPWEWALPAGLPIAGVLLTDQVRSLDWRSRAAEFAGRVDLEEMPPILQAARRLLT